MAWTTPRTWVTGELVSATLLNNHVRDQFNFVTRALVVKSTEKDVVNTTTATDVLNAEAVIPAGAMGTNGLLRCRLIGDYKNQAGLGAQPLELAVILGGTTFWRDTTTSIPNQSTRHDWVWEFDIGNQNSAAVNYMSGVFHFSKYGPATVGIGDLDSATTSDQGPYSVPFGTQDSQAIDTTSVQTLQATAKHAVANANLSFRLKYAMIELVGQAA